jgi:3-methyladenine DNA glycosylase AlkC
MEKITSFTSFEFAVRPFIIKYPAEMMDRLLIWSKHPNENVRRFSSEACRPRLPWGLQLRAFVSPKSYFSYP